MGTLLRFILVTGLSVPIGLAVVWLCLPLGIVPANVLGATASSCWWVGMQSWVFRRRILGGEIAVRLAVVVCNIALAWTIHQLGVDALLSSVVALTLIFPLSYLLSARVHRVTF